ncbi:MAG: SCP2 sterol-binding domain-containing protein [Ottowia sp.]
MTNAPHPLSLAARAVEKLAARVFEKLPAPPAPPAWFTEEMQRRAVLLLNHVLMQEPEARARLARQKGRVVRLLWRQWAVQLAATPAGLCELADAARAPDLRLTVSADSPLTLAAGALRGEKPAIRIEGDVQLAAEVNWLADHLRWDVEEDLARLLGDVPAHAVASAGRALAAALRQFAARPQEPQGQGGPASPPVSPPPAA